MPPEPAAVESGDAEKDRSDPDAPELPGFFSQFATLLSRRWRIFFRDRGQVFLQLAIILCFPLLVTIFSDKASGNIRRYSDTRQTDIAAEIQEQQSVRADQAKVGSAISGIIMFQVVLLSLMGSNNSAREIAGERPIYEKEKFGGLRPSAYLASKVAFLACLVIGAIAVDGVFRELLRHLPRRFHRARGLPAAGQRGDDRHLPGDFLADADGRAGIAAVDLSGRFPAARCRVRCSRCRKTSRPSPARSFRLTGRGPAPSRRCKPRCMTP